MHTANGHCPCQSAVSTKNIDFSETDECHITSKLLLLGNTELYIRPVIDFESASGLILWKCEQGFVCWPVQQKNVANAKINNNTTPKGHITSWFPALSYLLINKTLIEVCSKVLPYWVP